jgi:hypothetical protein
MQTHRFAQGTRAHPVAVLMAAVALLTACAGGAWVTGTGVMDLGPVIAIQPGGPHQGETSTGKAGLTYTYHADFREGAPATLRLAGQLLDGLRRGAGIGVYVLHLDDGGRLLDKKVLMSTGGGGYGSRRSFDAVLHLPAGTRAFRFASYSGPDRGHR